MDKLEYRALIKFFTLKGLKPQAIEEEIKSVYPTTCPSLRTIERHYNEFKHGRESLEDDHRSGRPATSTNQEKVDAVAKLVDDDRRIRVANIAHTVGISAGSVVEILHEILGYNKVSARWVPRMLSREHKQNRVHSSRLMLGLYNENPDQFERRIITGDECWLYHYDPESKRDSLEWRRPGEGAPRKFKQTKSAGKILGCFFWDSQGILLAEYLPVGHTVTGVRYAEQLGRLRQAVVQKRRGKLSARPLLLHDNAPAHTAQVAVHAATTAGFEILPHPAYSPDLAPSDFYLFCQLKRPLRGHHFESNEEVITLANQWLEDQPAEFYTNGIRALRDRWHKCIDRQGDYVEK